MKKYSLIIILFTGVMLLPLITSAVDADIFNEPVKISGAANEGGDIAGSINHFYRVALGLGGIAAVAVIVIGGIMYATSGAIDKKNTGKNLITSAIWGLVLLLGAFIILNTINPQITRLSENVPGIGGGVGKFEGKDYGTGGPNDPFSCQNQLDNNLPECTNKVAHSEDAGCCNPKPPEAPEGACTEEKIETCTPKLTEGKYKIGLTGAARGGQVTCSNEIKTLEGKSWRHLYYKVDNKDNVLDTQCVTYKYLQDKVRKIDCVVWGDAVMSYDSLGSDYYKPCNY